MVTILSTVGAYQRLAVVPSGPDRVQAWIDQYEAAYADIFTAYYRGYGNPGTRTAAAAQVENLAAEVARREQRLRVVLARIEAEFVSLGLLSSGTDLPVVLLVGTGHSDAWVDIFRDAPTMFVALEMVGDPPDDEFLATHELVHVAHYQKQWPTVSSQPQLRDQVAFRVWAEGLAVAGTRLLNPGHPDASYLFADGEQWIRDCRAQLPTLSRTLRKSLTATDPHLVHALCGVTNEQPWPSRAGYWIGDRIVQELLESGHRMGTLLAWRPDQVVEAVRQSSVLRHGD